MMNQQCGINDHVWGEWDGRRRQRACVRCGEVYGVSILADVFAAEFEQTRRAAFDRIAGALGVPAELLKDERQ